MAETKNIRGVEIFASGEWNGDKFNDSDLDTIVSSFEETKEKLRPYLKLGHNSDQEILHKDGLPSAGFIDRVYKVGKKIMADITGVPEKIYELIKNRAYDRVSSEIFVNMKVGEKTYPYALKAVALLGGDTPAVHDLNSILNLYSNEYDSVNFNAVKGYEIASSFLNLMQEDNKMTLDEAVRQVAKLEAEMKSLSEENASLEKDLEIAQTHIKESDAKIAEYKEKAELLGKEMQENARIAFEKEVDAEVEKFVSENKIVPAQKELLAAILKNVKMTDETKSFTINEKEYKDVKSLVKAFIDAHVEIEIEEEGKSVNTATFSDEDSFIEKVKKYAQDNKLTFKDAYIALVPKEQHKDEE